MANTQKARFSFSLTDGLGTKASLSLYAMLDPTKTIGDLAQAWQDQAALVQGLCDAGCEFGSAAIEMDAGADAAASASRVEQNALFNYLVPTSGRHHGIAVPGIASSEIVDGRPDMTEDGDADKLADALTGNVVSSVGPVTVGIWTSSDYLALGALADVGLSFRKHRRQVRRESTFVPTT
jgi:hypothetical protein